MRRFLILLTFLLLGLSALTEGQIRLRQSGVAGPPPPPQEICGNGIDDDGDMEIDEGCEAPQEICGNGIDDDGDELIDEGCPVAEICYNSVDDDLDGLIDEGCPPLSAELLSAGDLTFIGTFKVPDDAEFNNAIQGLTYNQSNDTLLIMTGQARTAAISIPTPSMATTLAALPRATYVVTPRDIYEGKRDQVYVSGDPPNVPGGMLIHGSFIYMNAWTYYDANGTQAKTHFRRPLDITNTGNVTNATAIHTCTQVFGCFPNGGGGIISGPMAPIPVEYQTEVGGKAIVMQCCIPIITRTSAGPSFSAWDPDTFGTSVQLHMRAFYDQNHQTLGAYTDPNGNDLFSGPTQVKGVVWPDGYRSVLFFGRHGTGGFCYGVGSPQNPPPPGQCYDPIIPEQGNHTYPYHYQVWAFDAQQYIDRKNGVLPNDWSPVPYAFWRYPNLPFAAPKVEFLGATWDPTRRRIYVSQAFGEQGRPVIYVFQIP